MIGENTGHLDTSKIDRQLAGKGDHYERKDDSGMYKRILEALIVASIISLVVAVWNVTQTVTLLQASQESLEKSTRRDIDRMERRQDSLEGKLTRGELPNAPDKQ